MADAPKTTPSAPPPKKSLADRVAEKTKSRSFNPTFVDGKAQLFNIKNYGVDYTAGGQLQARWVANDDARISIMKAQGYEFPDEWDSELPRKSFGGLTLMLREQKAAEHHRNTVESLARQQDAKRAAIPDQYNKPWNQGGVQGAITATVSQERVTHSREPITPD